MDRMEIVYMKRIIMINLIIIFPLFFIVCGQKQKGDLFTISDSVRPKLTAYIFLYNYLNPTQYCAIAQRGSKADDGIADTVFNSTDALYSTGYASGAINSESRIGASDFFIAKHDLAGNLSWIKQFGSALNDYGFSLAIDTKNTLYVGGAVQGSIDGNVYAGSLDLFLASYDADGNKKWFYQSGTSGMDIIFGLTTDSSSNSYVVGASNGNLDGNTNLGGQDAFLMKINSLGTRQWTTLLGTSSDDFAYSVATDDSGNIYVVGITNGNLNGNVNAGGSDIFLTKYDSSGNLLWTRLIGTAGDDSSSGIVIDKSQNIYISGYVTGGLSGNTQLGGSDAVILKYDSSGNQIWSRQIGGTNDDVFSDIVIDSENSLILTGSSNSSTLDGNTNAGGYDILLAKYDTSGQKLLVKLYGTANNDYGFSVATGLNKNIYISGQTEGAFAGNTSKGKFDMFVMPLTTNGNCFLIK